MIGCESLDQGADGAITSEAYYTTENTLDAGVTGIYSNLQKATKYPIMFASYTGADDLTSRLGSNKAVVLEGDQFALTGGNSWTYSVYTSYYKTILSCNSFLEDAHPEEIDKVFLNNSLANAHFVRAITYFRLVTSYGSVPMPLTTKTDLTIPLTPKREIMSQIIKDLEYANLWLVNDRDVDPTVANNKASKTAAKAFLAKTYMQLTGWPYNETEHWAKVKTLTKEIIDAGIYSLVDDYAYNFQRDYQDNKEIIFVHGNKREAYPIKTQNNWYGYVWGKWMDFYMEWTYYNNFPEGYRKDFCAIADNTNPHFNSFGHPVVTKFEYGTITGLPSYENGVINPTDL